jgi:hypothetical protein
MIRIPSGTRIYTDLLCEIPRKSALQSIRVIRVPFLSKEQAFFSMKIAE